MDAYLISLQKYTKFFILPNILLLNCRFDHFFLHICKKKRNFARFLVTERYKIYSQYGQ